MTFRTLTATAALALSTSAAFAAGHAGNAGYALANDGNTLVVMTDIAMPNDVMTFDLANDLDAIAFRPVTGELLGFAGDAIYTIDTSTGMLTDLGATFMDDAMIADDAMVAFDFNNAIDAVRAVSSNGDNLVYFPEGFGDMDERAGSVLRFTDLAYAEGDASFGAEPLVFANAYTNAIAGMTAESTFQYALDARANALISLANNAGTLETIGLITIDGEAADILPMGGFDIISPSVGEDQAYAILQIDGQETAGLYSIDLTSGNATLLSDLGMGGFSGFAASMGM
ncbi:DUF4394 domain-containing protein [Flavimaricola marinus]|uniref:DUF4394 domain-containing protein n=1 Tax=Flavimaricola marinus TaxID=1819565 RepID=A0A238LHA4_9RHOB|nr:DUF4394 domain-containing protein [Flavimaricola marinus]SMY09031.1 hypothetical protein LOM8899_03192 [Flavimaricola marinus]